MTDPWEKKLAATLLVFAIVVGLVITSCQVRAAGPGAAGGAAAAALNASSIAAKAKTKPTESHPPPGGVPECPKINNGQVLTYQARIAPTIYGPWRLRCDYRASDEGRIGHD